jgi:adenylate kinase family enzyme
MNKILIMGDSGRGKSTLAEHISKKLGIPHYSTDDFYYEQKFSVPRNRDLALKQISEMYDKNEWIIEGTTLWLLHPGLPKADQIIYLKFSNILSQYFVLIRRFFVRGDDSVKDLLLLMHHLFKKRYGLGYKKGQPTTQDLLKPYSNKVITLSSYKEIDEFLKTITE